VLRCNCLLWCQIFLILRTSFFTPQKVRQHNIFNSPCTKSREYCRHPVTVAVISPPRSTKMLQSWDIFIGRWLTVILILFFTATDCISINNIPDLSFTNQKLPSISLHKRGSLEHVRKRPVLLPCSEVQEQLFISACIQPGKNDTLKHFEKFNIANFTVRKYKSRNILFSYFFMFAIKTCYMVVHR